MNLVEKLRVDFGQFSFVSDEICRWSPSDNTIYYCDGDEISLLHELGHALCGHNSFVQDVELLHIERDAWDRAREIAPKYGVVITDDAVEDALDGYRDWLHRRSICPNCTQNGVQSRSSGHYRCLNCNNEWQVNDARQCGLQRRSVKNK